VSVNGYFEFDDCDLYKNYANSDPISILFDTGTSSIVRNSSIHDNKAFTKSEIDIEFNTN